MRIKFHLMVSGLCLTALNAFSQGPEIYVQTGHSSPAGAVALSGDGKFLASGSKDHTVKLWDMASGEELKTLRGHTEPVNSVAFSPDSKTLASGGWDGQVRLWDVASGRLLRSLSHDQGANTVAFSPDGRMLASGGFDFRIKVWEVTSGRELKSFMPKIEAAENEYRHKFKEAGRSPQIVPASFVEMVRGTEPAGMPKELAFNNNRLVDGEDPSHIVWSVAWSPDSRRIAGCSFVAVRVWDIASGTEVKTITDKMVFHTVAISPDGKIAAVGFSSPFEEKVKTCGIKLYDLATGQLLRTMTGHEDAVQSIVFSPNGASLASSSLDGTIRFWDVLSGRQTKLIKDPVGKLETIAFSRDGRILVSGSEDQTLRLWDAATTKQIKTFKGHSSPGTYAALSADGRRLAMGLENGSIKLWDISGQQELQTLKGHKFKIESLAFSPDGKTLASASWDDSIKLWDANTGRELRTLQGHADSVWSVAFSPDGRFLASLSKESTILWDVASGQELRSFKTQEKGRTIEFDDYVSFLGDGKILATGRWPSGLVLWDVDTGQVVRTVKIEGSVLAFSPDGRTAAEVLDTSVRLWDLSSGQQLKSMEGHSHWVTSLAFSPDGRIVASGSGDNTVKLWDVATGRELRTLNGHSGKVTSVAFSADGKTLLSSSEDGRTNLWDANSGNAIASLITLDENDWVVVAPDGRFNGSPDGIKLISYVQDNKLLPLDSFFEKFFTPKLLQQVYAREAAQASTANVDFSKRIKLPPLVRITSPKPGATSASDAAQIIVEATDQGGGVEDIRLYQNGKLISDDTRQLTRAPGAKNKTFDVTLLPGINTFRATAFNTDRTEAAPDEIKIELKAAEASSNLYILAIGLNEYKNTRYNLNYGRADAQAVADAVEQRGHGIFKQINKRVIFDADATRANIEAAFREVIKQARPQDAFVFYYAGHGVMSESNDKNPADFYLVPYEVVRIYGDDGSLTTNGIAARNLRELFRNVLAQKQLIILDACESGGAVETIAMRGASEEKAIIQLARSAGVAVLASAGQDQLATEFGKLGHGVFTYALLKGLSGEADGAPKDGKVTVKELEAYINDQVPELTKLYRGKRQDPNSWTRGQDFPISIR